MIQNINIPAQFKIATAISLCLVLLMTGLVQSARAQGSAAQDIVLMLDNSGSMRKNDPNFLTRVAVTTFINGLQGDVQVAIIMFDQNVRQLMPLTQLNDATRQDFLNALDALDYRGLLTNSPAALEKSTYELRTKGRANSQKSIIFMTDGIVDVGKDGFDEGDVEKARWMKTTLVDEAAKYQISIYGIAYTDNADFELIQTLSSRTGGEYYRAATGDDIERVFNAILDTLSSAVQTSTPATPTTTIEPVVTTEITPQSDTSTDSETTPLAESSADAITPELSLPESTLPQSGLPEVSLPETTLPESTLPEANTLPDSGSTPAVLPEVDTPEATSDSGEGATDPSAENAPSTAEISSAPEQQTAQPPSSSPVPEANLPVAMLAGASALLLALIAFVLYLIKRKPSAAAGGADPLMPKAFLNDVGNATDQNSYELGEKPTIIGRLAGSDPQAANYIVIDESTIGRRHSLIEYKEHSFWVADQNSLNGTFVNLKRIETSTRLKHGDRLRFHKHEFEFLILDMFETDRTMMSQTVFAERSADTDEMDIDDEDATEIREPSSEDETIRRPD